MCVYAKRPWAARSQVTSRQTENWQGMLMSGPPDFLSPLEPQSITPATSLMMSDRLTRAFLGRILIKRKKKTGTKYWSTPLQRACGADAYFSSRHCGRKNKTSVLQSHSSTYTGQKLKKPICGGRAAKCGLSFGGFSTLEVAVQTQRVAPGHGFNCPGNGLTSAH